MQAILNMQLNEVDDGLLDVIRNLLSKRMEILIKTPSDDIPLMNEAILADSEQIFSPDMFSDMAKKLREKTKQYLLTEELLNQLKNEGRP